MPQLPPEQPAAAGLPAGGAGPGPPGWYADPWHMAERRYFDGTAWTGYLDPVAAPAPPSATGSKNPYLTVLRVEQAAAPFVMIAFNIVALGFMVLWVAFTLVNFPLHDAAAAGEPPILWWAMLLGGVALPGFGVLRGVLLRRRLRAANLPLTTRPPSRRYRSRAPRTR